MPEVYVLELCNGNFYIGSTRNLKQRLVEHQKGKSGYTSKYLPLKLVYHKSFQTYSEARKTEEGLKKIKNRSYLLRMIGRVVPISS